MARAQARREGIRAARGGRRRHPRRRRRHRLSHHRLDADGQSRAWCSAIRARRAACCKKATSSTWSLPPAIAATRRRSARRSALGAPTEMVRKFWDEITLPGYKQHHRRDHARQADREHAHRRRSSSATTACSRARSQCHGIDLVTDNPHVSAEHVKGEEIDMVLKPGMIIMAEPNPITPDGNFRHLPRPHLHRDQ